MTNNVAELEPGVRGAETTGRTVRRVPGPAQVNPGGYRRRRLVVDNALRWGTPVALVVVWQVVCTSGAVDRRFWPAPTDIVDSFGQAISSGVLLEATVSSLVRILVGFAFGAAAGIVLGILLGTMRPLRVALDPIISALYTVPKLAILPLLLLVFGLGDTPKIILVALGVFFIVVISTTAAVCNVADAYMEPARSFGASTLQTFRHVTVPAVLPEVFTSLRIGIGNAILLLIGVEFVQGQEGLGFLIWNSWQIFLADRMYVGIVTVAVLGVLMQSSVAWLGRRLAPWTRGRD